MLFRSQRLLVLLPFSTPRPLVENEESTSTPDSFFTPPAQANAVMHKASRSLIRPTSLTPRRALPISPFLTHYLSPRLSHSRPSLQPLLASRSFGTSFPRSFPPPSSKEVVPTSTTEKALAKDAPKKGTRMQRIWATVKKEALHYWHGTKLLGKEIRISARIQGRLLAGKKLTRREHRQVRLLHI